MKLKFRNAKELAALLDAAGIKTGRTIEPNDEVDGMIVLTPDVHIQVPLRGQEPNVVRESAGGKLEFADPRATLEDLSEDIATARAGLPFPDEDDEE